jgi:hypothetical protein
MLALVTEPVRIITENDTAAEDNALSAQLLR